MSSSTVEARFKLYYWPIAFRGCFISYLFAYRGVPLFLEDNPSTIQHLISEEAGEQSIPFMGPPVLLDLQSGRTLSQMPAIVWYAADELDLLPSDQFDAAGCMKVLMDCNDVLMEICRYNGSIMWSREEWLAFRAQRFPRWLQIFEESLQRDFIGKSPVTFADVGVFALFGNMIRCIPNLEPDILLHAPGIHALCQKIGSHATLAEYVSEEEKKYGKVYCGGQIEASIRKMLAQDTEQS